MKLPLPCCRPSPCGTWPASFSIATLCALEVKNNSMLECFAVSLRGTEFTPPMSRRQVTNRRELLLPLLIPDRHQIGVLFDVCVPSDPATAVHGKAGERPNAWTRHNPQCRAAEQAGQTTEVGIAELIAQNQLLARLVFQRIRPGSHAQTTGGQGCSSDELRRSRTPMAPPDLTTSLIKCVEVPVSAPVPPPIETLFTQLARRRLRSRDPAETR
jgi:hypothetical protein